MYARWRKHGRSFDLGRMGLGDLWKAYGSHPAVHLYVAGALGGAVIAMLRGDAGWAPLRAVLLTLLVYPLAWYLIHRFVLHSRFLYRSPLTAALWKRIHFDHHQDPHRMDVLFGSPLTTVPTIVAITLPLGWVAGGGIGGAAAAVATGFAVTCIYEFCHCVQHLNFKPRSRLLRRMKELHLNHHFQDEHGNFGITSFLIDRVFGTYYASARERNRSPHVFNLGYDATEAARYPWVARLSGEMPRDRPRRAGDAGRAVSEQAGGAA
ncbi:sterol desaturase family protein [Rhizosaccharibacter radicis]|uniref:Sterol desaturase family protein n=1 Tax=Rhizosaccharibacter radicis TaxID=2782605 RepID=A0ABT1VV17_9PROT|nr:sterol desaturase family protein [Acetobacteraceae bacterium KSS12]